MSNLAKLMEATLIGELAPKPSGTSTEWVPTAQLPQPPEDGGAWTLQVIGGKRIWVKKDTPVVPTFSDVVAPPLPVWGDDNRKRVSSGTENEPLPFVRVTVPDHLLKRGPWGRPAGLKNNLGHTSFYQFHTLEVGEAREYPAKSALEKKRITNAASKYGRLHDWTIKTHSHTLDEKVLVYRVD
jgi:hypothetical protein